MTTYPVRYTWRNNEKQVTLTGRRCRVARLMSGNCAIVEFENGQIEVVRRNALRPHIKLSAFKPL
jgi:hypothetical protein